MDFRPRQRAPCPMSPFPSKGRNHSTELTSPQMPPRDLCSAHACVSRHWGTCGVACGQWPGCSCFTRPGIGCGPWASEGRRDLWRVWKATEGSLPNSAGTGAHGSQFCSPVPPSPMVLLGVLLPHPHPVSLCPLGALEGTSYCADLNFFPASLVVSGEHPEEASPLRTCSSPGKSQSSV